MNPHSNPRFTFAPKSEGAFLPRAGPTAAQHFANARWKLSPALLARGFVPSGNQVENWGSPPHPQPSTLPPGSSHLSNSFPQSSPQIPPRDVFKTLPPVLPGLHSGQSPFSLFFLPQSHSCLPFLKVLPSIIIFFVFGELSSAIL